MATFAFTASLVKRSIAYFAIILVVVLSSSSIAASASPPLSNVFLHSRQASSTNLSTPSQHETESLNKIRENVHCYALPYGGLGFGSHVLTYYCMFVNAYGRRPLVPWKRQEYQKLDVFIGFLQLTGTTITGSLTITRCKGEGHLQLLGIWMLLTSAASSVAAMLGHGRWLFASRSKEASREVDRSILSTTVTYDPNEPGPPAPSYDPADMPQYNMSSQPYYTQPKPYPLTSYYSTPQYEAVNMRGGSGRRTFFARDKRDFRQEGNKYGQWVSWGLIISLWLVGCAMGFIGSIGIAREVWKIIAKVREITTWFFMPAAVMLSLTILLCLCAGKKKPDGSIEHSEGEAKAMFYMMKWTSKVCLFLLVFMLVYMDWLLAAVTDNWSGVPSKLDKNGKVLYWLGELGARKHFLAKRI